MPLSEKEITAFDGLEESYREMEKKIDAPKCHFTPMSYEASDYEEWWECKHCGHTKGIGMMSRSH